MGLYFLLISLSLVLLTNCKTGLDKPNITPASNSRSEDSFDSNKYNLEIRPTTKIECSMLTERPMDTTIENEPYFLDTTYFYRFQSVKGMNHKYRLLWPCNLPDLLKPGDSVLLSGILYAISGDEKMPGTPMMITKIVLNDKYINGLKNFNKK